MEKHIRPDGKLFSKGIMILATLTVFFIIIAAILHLIIDLAEGNPQAPPVIWLVTVILVALMWAVSLPISWLWIQNLSYVVMDDRITIHKGILTKVQQNIPMRAVTDFALNRSLYDRALGIGAIKIQTAGQSQSGTGYEGSLSGLVEYDSLHEKLRGWLKSLHPISESLTVGEPAEREGVNVQFQILRELQKIREILEKQK